MHHFSWLHFILHSPESKQPCELCQAYVQRHIWTRIIFAYYNCNCAEAFKEIKVTKIVVWPRKKFSDRLNLQEQLTLFRNPAPNALVTFNCPFTRSLNTAWLSSGCSALILKTSCKTIEKISICWYIKTSCSTNFSSLIH
jgi:hypothetical protein